MRSCGRAGAAATAPTQRRPDEYVEIATIVPCYRALKEFLERLPAQAWANQLADSLALR
jgi:hypothetical protein